MTSACWQIMVGSAAVGSGNGELVGGTLRSWVDGGVGSSRALGLGAAGGGAGSTRGEGPKP